MLAKPAVSICKLLENSAKHASLICQSDFGARQCDQSGFLGSDFLGSESELPKADDTCVAMTDCCGVGKEEGKEGATSAAGL